MALPSRVYFTLIEAAARWGCTAADVAAWASVGRLEIVTGIAPIRCGAATVGGIVGIEAADILPMFRRCGTGPSQITMRRIRDLAGNVWHFITEPGEGVSVAGADLLITAAEALRFEEEHDLLKRPHAGVGPALKYDWEGMYVQVTKRIHDQGLPDSQQLFVAEIVAWFVDRSKNGDVPDESTIRRRLSPIWRALRDQV